MRRLCQPLVCRATQLTAAASLLIALITPVIAADTPSVAVRANEGVRYVPQGAPGGTPAGVVRTLDIAIANLTDRQIDLTIEYAMFALDTKNALKPMSLSGGAANKGKTTLSLAPREQRLLRAEAHHAGELANAGQSAFGKPRDIGNALDPAYNTYRYFDPATGRYYRPAVAYVPPPPLPPNGNINDPNYRRAYNDWYNRYYGNYDYNIYNYRPPEIQTTPQTVQRMGQAAQTQSANTASGSSGAAPTTERYYGYSIVVYSEGEIVARLDKNPANIANFGVTNIKDAPVQQPRRR